MEYEDDDDEILSLRIRIGELERTVRELNAKRARELQELEEERVRKQQEFEQKMAEAEAENRRLQSAIKLCNMKYAAFHSYTPANVPEEEMEWEEEILTLDLSGLGYDLGLALVDSIIDPLFVHSGIYVSAVHKDSIFHGKLKTNDRIVRVKNLDCSSGVSQSVVLEELAANCDGDGTAVIVIRRRRVPDMCAFTTQLDGSYSHGLTLEPGIYISKIRPGSFAARESSIAVGDRVLSILEKELKFPEEIQYKADMEPNMDEIRNVYEEKVNNLRAQLDRKAERIVDVESANTQLDLLNHKLQIDCSCLTKKKNALEKNYAELRDLMSRQLQENQDLIVENVHLRESVSQYKSLLESEETRWYCSDCAQDFNTHAELKEHQKTEGRQQMLECEYCIDYFSNRVALEQHIESRHPDVKPTR